ncbi:MAG: hypothetical protein MJ078_02305 [Clostridia bacterium]|nr:hypothetical protein [Clostridia bacterium]
MKAGFQASIESIVTEKEKALLERAADILYDNVVCDEKTLWYPYRGMVPSLGHFRGVWNWDSAFHAMGAALFDIDLAKEQFKMFFSFQHTDGFLPDCICTDGSIVDTLGKPPVWPQAVEAIDRQSPDDAFLKYAYSRLIRNECFWRSRRFAEKDGLFFYSTEDETESRDLSIRYESGWDNAVRWDMGIEGMYPIDLNCYAVGYYGSMGYIADRLGFSDDALLWQRRKEDLAKQINAKLYDASDGCYYDYSFAKHCFSKVLSPASLMPLYVGIASEEQAEKMHRFARDPKKLYPGMPTVSYDNPCYEDEGYWRGPTWLNVAYFAVKGLYDYGFLDTALGIRNEILSWIYDSDSIYENYDSKRKKPLCAPHFGWSAVFVMKLILDVR